MKVPYKNTIVGSQIMKNDPTIDRVQTGSNSALNHARDVNATSQAAETKISTTAVQRPVVT
jgi:hypothetical protein